MTTIKLRTPDAGAAARKDEIAKAVLLEMLRIMGPAYEGANPLYIARWAYKMAGAMEHVRNEQQS